MTKFWDTLSDLKRGIVLGLLALLALWVGIGVSTLLTETWAAFPWLATWFVVVLVLGYFSIWFIQKGHK